MRVIQGWLRNGLLAGLFGWLTSAAALPRPPLTLPLPLAQAGQIRTLDFEIVEEFGYTLAIRFYHAPPASAAVLDHLPLELWVELLQLQGSETTSLLAEQRTLGRLQSHGENNRTRTLDSIHLLPGQYRLVIKTVQDHPMLHDIDTRLIVGKRPFKVALPGKQPPSPTMQKLLHVIKEKQWLDHPEALQPLPKDTRLAASLQGLSPIIHIPVIGMRVADSKGFKMFHAGLPEGHGKMRLCLI